ncbi:FixH family protein [Actinokineospora globicatena]|uniref:YtkA-like domain-containing protein n=1 Tax=Actinokineospora globicatena TaxID=103729 RepID=A0A9W6QIT1_9PSEU|nr:FixH family protein [Actinokineospora globicatena]GLW89274.1 hypothetical protein Aglo03_00900 [Actinokineospora globicatena]
MTRRGKAALIVVVAIIAGLLVAWWTTGDDPVDLRAGTATYAVRLHLVDPGVGANTVDIEVADRTGSPVDAEVTVEPVMVDMGHALTPTKATPTHPGHYRAERTDLPMAGPWELTVTVRRADTTERAVFSLII